MLNTTFKFVSLLPSRSFHPAIRFNSLSSYLKTNANTGSIVVVPVTERRDIVANQTEGGAKKGAAINKGLGGSAAGGARVV